MESSSYYAQLFTFLRGHALQASGNRQGWQPADLDFNRPCTSVESGRECWLCFQLPHWNSVLNPLGLNLSEVEPGRLELATFKPVANMHIVSTHNRQAWCSIFFLTWLPRKHRCVHFLAVRRSLPCVPYSGWRLAPEESRFGAGKQCHLRHVIWKMDSVNWGLLELFQEDATKLETLEVSFGQGTRVVIPDEFRQLVRRSAGTLQTFRLYMSSHSDACERLGEIALCQSLVELDIALTRATLAPQTIARILSSTSALRKLSFYYPPYSLGDRAFADALTRNRTLLEVRVGSPSIEAFGVVCDALTENSSVRILSLVCMLPRGQLMTPDDKVASLLRGNTVLESLTLSGFRCFIEDPDSVAGALGDNAALKSLTCAPDCTMLAGVVSRLVAALERNKTLQRIQVDAVFGSREQRRALAALVVSLECSHRIEVQYWHDSDLLTMLPMLTAPLATPRDVWLVVDDIQPKQASALRTALAGPHGVPLRKLSLVSERRWPHCVRDAVKDILVSNSSLESLEIAESIRYFDLAAYSQDLAELSSAVWSSSKLSHLTITTADHLYHAEYAEWLVAVLRNSKSIVSLSVSQQMDNYSGERAFNVMAMGLLLNPFVVDIDIDGPVQDTRDYIFSRTVTRNRTRVNDAARFVTGADSSSRCARAFELLRTKQSLLRLITRVTRGTEDDARKAIRVAFGQMRDNLLRSAGVVKSSVTCWPADVTQIDALNIECWRAISRYLNLHDVLVQQW